MNTLTDRIRLLTIFIGLSVLVHLLVLFSLGQLGSYNFVVPVNPLQAVMVDLTKPSGDNTPVADSDDQKSSYTDKAAEDVTDDGNHAQAQGEEISAPPAVLEKSPVEQRPVEPAVIDEEKGEITTRSNEPTKNPQPTASRHALFAIPPPLRTAGEFLTSENEKLSYLVSLRGIPMGSMDLEAKNINGDVWITLRVRSNTALSGIYPVDDIIETRHIGGNFIITKVKQQEGAFSSDIGFTIFLRDRRIFWIDNTRNRYSNETIPTSDVLDTLSSFYYLRNRPLQAGKTEILHIYDGDAYAPVPVEIVRQEQIRLRNFKKVDTLLLRHIQQKSEIFKRTGDMLIWVTNDENKVPVKIETTTQLGKVTAELVSAESKRSDDPGIQN
jgi:hypothetical protein